MLLHKINKQTLAKVWAIHMYVFGHETMLKIIMVNWFPVGRWRKG